MDISVNNFRIAEFNIRIIFRDTHINNMRLLPSFESFRVEEALENELFSFKQEIIDSIRNGELHYLTIANAIAHYIRAFQTYLIKKKEEIKPKEYNPLDDLYEEDTITSDYGMRINVI